MSRQVKAVLFVGALAAPVAARKGIEISDLEGEDSILVFPYPDAKLDDVYVGIPVLESSVYYPYTATDNEHSQLLPTIATYMREFEQRFGEPGRLMISPNIS